MLYSYFVHSTSITSLKLSPADIWRLYRQRANCENRIKELKYDYSLDKMNQVSFDGTEATLILMTVAYNFLSLFKQLTIGGNVRNRLKTLRHIILAIPAIVEHSNDRTIVKMALHMNRRAWFFLNYFCELLLIRQILKSATVRSNPWIINTWIASLRSQ